LSALSSSIELVRRSEPIRVTGRIASLRGLMLAAEDLPAPVGALVRVRTRDDSRLAEVVGFDHDRTLLMTLEPTSGIRPGDMVETRESRPTVGVGELLLGRVIDGLGQPIDGKHVPRGLDQRLIHADPLGAMQRAPIENAISTGVRAIDSMTTVGRGQRMGIFAGPGVGKSTLMGMIARGAESAGGADVNVIGLIGERGREVKDFIRDALGPEGLRKSIVVVSTSDQSPVLRLRAAHVACAVAEHFRDKGASVMMMVDSVTRFAHAQRQVGLAVGEPPATRGYTPSVFSALAGLLERAGAVELPGGGTGSITGFYTVLVEGDDMTEPVTDAVRGILDGHVMLSRKLGQKGHFPAIDALDSVSRIANEITGADVQAARRRVLSLLAAHREVEELLQIGAYAEGQNPLTDTAVAFKDKIDGFLCQGTRDITPTSATLEAMATIAAAADAELSRRGRTGGSVTQPPGGGGVRRGP
jgi:flagellum-specific ATP synthase